MKLGIANEETWIFLEPIYKYLSGCYPTQIFKPKKWPLVVYPQKMNHYMLRRSLQDFLHERDVVLFEWASALLVEASLLKDSSSSALVTRLHRYEMFEWVHRVNWKAVEYAILDTQAMRMKLLSRTELPPERAVVIPPIAISPDTIDLHPRPFQGNIGILSVLHPRKRVYELIMAFASLLHENPDLKLHIGGEKRPDQQDYFEALEYLTHRLGIENQVIFYGRVEDRMNWYRMLDVFVSFSYSEGMQVAPLEAAACNCYCLSHWWEGAEECYPPDQLFTTESEFVTKTLQYCCAPDSEREKMKEPMREFIRTECDSQKINTSIQNILELAYKDPIR